MILDGLVFCLGLSKWWAQSLIKILPKFIWKIDMPLYSHPPMYINSFAFWLRRLLSNLIPEVELGRDLWWVINIGYPIYKNTPKVYFLISLR